MPPIDITDKIGFALLKKGVIDYETLEKSLRVKDSEDKKNRRNLGQILVNDFGADHDAVFREVADLYAFREIYLADEAMDKARLDFIKKYVDGLPQTVRDMVVQSRMLPLKFDEKQPDKLIIISADPTDRRIPLIAREFGAKKYEVAYCRLKDLQNLLEQVIPPENEFLKLLENSQGASRSRKRMMTRWSTKRPWKRKSARAPSSTSWRARSWKLSARDAATCTSSPRRGTAPSSGSVPMET